MILYQVISGYHLLNAIVHKIKYNSDKKCLLMISEWICDIYPQINNLKEFFDVIILFNAVLKVDKEANYLQENTNYCRELLENNGIEIDNLSEIHVYGAHYCFGAFLAFENIPFIFWEDSAGILSRKEILNNINAAHPEKRDFCEKMGLYDGGCKCVIKRICNFNAQVEEFQDDLAENFDVIGEYLSISEKEQRAVKKFFTNIEKIRLSPDAVLILTQHFANLEVLLFEEHILIYQFVIDYFFDKEVVVLKPHPNDIMYYSQIFPRCQVVREKFPSEFLPVMFTNKPKTIATISSTAINNLYPYFANTFSLTPRYEKDFYATHRYYVALRLLKEANLENSQMIAIGADENLIKNLLCTKEIGLDGIVIKNDDNTEKINKFYLVDDIETQKDFDRERIIALAENLSDNSFIIFINFRQDFCFYDIDHKDLWKNIVPICIEKKQNREEEFYADINSETIYFYSKNERILNMADNFELKRELVNTGMTISVEKMTAEQKKIKVLEGILEATEKRLLYYIELVNKEKNK